MVAFSFPRKARETLSLTTPHQAGRVPCTVLAAVLLFNAIDAADYADAVDAVRAMGLDPKVIPHYKPPDV
jgi:hypothetical protein